MKQSHSFLKYFIKCEKHNHGGRFACVVGTYKNAVSMVPKLGLQCLEIFLGLPLVTLLLVVNASLSSTAFIPNREETEIK